MNLLKRIWQGFSGGPDFDTCEQLIFILDDKQLKLTVPKTPFHTEEPAKQINFPFRQQGWFEAHAEQKQQHKAIVLDTQLWPYFTGLRHIIPEANELGMLSLSTQLKQIPDSAGIDALNLTELGEYLLKEYDFHYNNPEIGNNGKGLNTELKEQAIAFANERTPAWSGQRLEQLIQVYLKRGKQPLYPAKAITIGKYEWLQYNEGTHDNDFHSYRYFCLPLDSKYFLNFRFTYKIDRHDKFKRWKANARAAEKRILEMVELGPIPAIERPVLEAR